MGTLPSSSLAASLQTALPAEVQRVLCRGSELDRRLRDRLQEEPLPTGVPPLDRLLDGGLHRGSLVELVGRGSCGRLAILLATLGSVSTTGEVVALVGPSGAGKTSIANLVCRFYDPIRGRVTVDGHDLQTVKLASLRGQVAVVLQETFLFNTTIRENLLYGKPDASQEEIIGAATCFMTVPYCGSRGGVERCRSRCPR